MSIGRRGFVLSVAAAALAACSPPQQGKTEDTTAPAGGPDPSALIRPLYDRYMTQGATFPPMLEQAPWSADLRAQLASMAARSNAANEPILDFDPIIGAQDYQITAVDVKNEAVAYGSHAVVRASFKNINEQTEIVYDLVWQGDAWKVDNIRGNGWDLRQIAMQEEAGETSP